MVEELSLPFASPDIAAEADLPALVAEYSALLFRVAHSILRNRAEAEDTVQDTFLRVLQRSDGIDGIQDRRAWLVRITWNLALDRRRRVRPEQMDDLAAAALQSPGIPADQALARARDAAEVFRAIDRLPAVERQALLLTTLEEIGIAEAAAVMKRSEAAVRALVFRARTRLRERIQKAGQA